MNAQKIVTDRIVHKPSKVKERILIIGPTPPPYHGVSVMTELILKSHLMNQKFEIIHLETSKRRNLRYMGKIDIINIFSNMLFFFRYLKILLSNAPSIVYVPISQTTLGYLRDCLFLIPAKLLGKKVIIHLHGGYFKNFYNQSGRLMRALIRWSLKDVRKGIILGESLKYIFQGLIPEERITVVPNGIDGRIFDEMRTQLSKIKSKKNRFKILFLSSLRKDKGFIDVLKSIPLFTAKRKDVEFVFAGEPRYEKYKDEVSRLLSTEFIHPFVNFIGTVKGKEKIGLFLSSDIFVFPTHLFEGHPLVILEAMASGLPVITTDQGCIKETVIDGENGFIIEKQNPEQIAEKILLLLENEELRKKMGKWSRKRFLKYYTTDTFIKRLSKVFEDVLN